MAEGDLCVFRARLELGGEGGATELLLASFHGDTNGLASTPVVSALRQQARLFSDGSQTVLRPPQTSSSETFGVEISCSSWPCAAVSGRKTRVKTLLPSSRRRRAFPSSWASTRTPT